jgi:hypothetical protein
MSATTSISQGEGIIKVNSNVNSIGLTLPSATNNAGLQYTIKRVGQYPVSLTGTAGQTIDGEAIQIINVNSGSITIVSDGSNYFIV